MKDDTISRAAAIKALEETKQSDPFDRYEYQNIGIDWSIDAIKALPSAQPVNIAKLQPNCNQVASDCASHCASHCASDCISRQAAISEIMEDIEDRSLHDDPATPEDYAEGYDEGIRNAAAIVLQMPSAQPGWIPTSERLPDNDRAVLVTLKWAEDDYEVAVGEYWHNSTASHGWGSFEGHVIAWHELPTPYREGGQE